MICSSLTFKEEFEVPVACPSIIMSVFPLTKLTPENVSKSIAASLSRLRYSQIEKIRIGILESIPREFCLTPVPADWPRWAPLLYQHHAGLSTL